MSALDIRSLKSTAEPQRLGYTWDREGKQVQWSKQSVGGAPIPWRSKGLCLER